MTEEPTHFSPDSYSTEAPQKTSRIVQLIKILATFSIILILFVAAAFWSLSQLNLAPENFPIGKIITIEQGTEVRAITEILEQKNVVKSAALLYYTLVLLHDPTNVKASSYQFEEPLATFAVAKLLTEGDFDTDLVRFTHFEGERATLIAKRAAEVLPNFNSEQFLLSAVPLEGRLFPETYFVPASFTDTELLTLLNDTFTEKISEFNPQIEKHPLSLEEILILASIIEREANDLESKHLVSSVLQNRMEIGMALQADASIEYTLDKPLAELTPDDLKVDSPYNTYLYPGLPPTPIGNPGLDAIQAVLEPAESDYYYYITDNEGEFHYAKTYNEHLQNIEHYLR